jgi:hypothetical protein
MLVKKTLVLLSVMAATPSPLLCPLVLRVSEMRYAVSQVFGNRSSRQVGEQALLDATRSTGCRYPLARVQSPRLLSTPRGLPVTLRLLW